MTPTKEMEGDMSVFAAFVAPRDDAVFVEF